MTRQSRIYEDPVDSSLRNIGVIPVYDPPLEEMLRKRKRAGRRWPEGAGGDEEVDLNNPPSFITLTPEFVLEGTPGAVVGVLGVIDADLPDDAHTFMVNDPRFEVVDGVLRLKAGQHLTFSVEPTVTVNVTATDRALASVTVAFDIEVLPILIPIPPNSPPTDILLNNTTVEANTLGAPVGYLTVVDADLPDETHTWAVDDIRFVIAGTVLQLKPTEQLSEATVDITVTVTDSDNQSFQRTFTITPEVGGSPDLDNALYITPTGNGALSGADWDNAGSLASLNGFIAAAAGRNILIRADTGVYNASLMNITAGGTVGAPAVVWGVDVNGVPLNTEILGVRQEPWTVGGATGTEVFRLLTGANNLRFRNIGFHNTGNGGFRIGADIANLTIDNCTGDNVMRFIENNISGTNPTASVTNLIVRRCWARGYSRNFARTQYASTFLYEDCFGDSERQDGANFAAGISFLGTAAGTVRRCEMKNNIDIVLNTTSDYYNGDGFSTEVGNNVVFEDCAASGNTDGGFDCKGIVALLRCRAANNKRNFRVWDTGLLTDCVGLDPRDQGDIFTQDQVWVAAGGNCTVTGCSFADQYAQSNVFELDAVDSTILVTDTAVQTDGDEILNPDGGSATVTTHAPPANTVIPAITGTPTGGFVLSASTGTWAVGGLTFTYQWKRSDLYIDGATADEYELIDDDVGETITVSVYATDADGDVGEATSLATAAVAIQNPANTVLPFIIGPRVVGGTLTADPGTWTGVPAPTFTYQWRASGSDIVGATDATYELTASEEGDNIDVEVTGDNGGVPTTATSAATSAILAAGGATEFFIRASAQGLGDGTSFANAGAFSALNGFIGGTAPGGTIYILATDIYIRTSVLALDRGGSAGNPITIRGVTSGLVPAQATIRSTRTAWTLPLNPETVSSVGSWTVGSRIFQLNSGASHLKFEYLNFERCGDGCFYVPAVVSHITVTDSAFYNVKRFWEMPDNTLAINNITVQRITGVGFSECFMRIRNGAHTYLVEDCNVNSGRQNGDNFAMGVQMSGGAHDIVFNRVIVRNCHDTVNSYWQGDGFVAEVADYNLTWNDCEVYGCTDGGWDIKSNTTVLNNCIAGDNKRNYRFWGDVVATDCTSITPFRRGGTGSSTHFHSHAAAHNHPILIRPVVISPAVSNQFLREDDAQMLVRDPNLSQSVGGLDSDGIIFYTGADVTPATVTSPLTHEVFDSAEFETLVVASEPALFKKLTNNDGALIARAYQTFSMTSKSFLDPQDTDLNNIYSWRVQLTDAGMNVSTQDISTEVKLPYAQAVTFDGTNDWISKSTNIPSQTNNPFFSAAGRIKFNAGDGTERLFHSQSAGIARLTRLASNKFEIEVKGGSGGPTFTILSASDWVVADGWIDFIVYVNSNFAAGLKIGKLWKRTSGQGQWVDDTGAKTDVGVAFTISYASRTGHVVFGSSGSPSTRFNGDASDFGISYSEGPDPALQATRDRLSLDDGTWVYPGVGMATFFGYLPRFAFQGKADVYGVNRGSASGVVLNGALVDSIDPPP